MRFDIFIATTDHSKGKQISSICLSFSKEKELKKKLKELFEDKRFEDFQLEQTDKTETKRTFTVTTEEPAVLYQYDALLSAIDALEFVDELTVNFRDNTYCKFGYTINDDTHRTNRPT